jgi:hypothetical protein
MWMQPSEPYVCGYCGRKCKTNEKLKKHFRDLHERERNKRMNRMNSLKGNKRLKYKLRLTEKEERYFCCQIFLDSSHVLFVVFSFK